MTKEEEKVQARQILTDYLDKMRCRKTSERYVLLDIAYDQPMHFTADDLMQKLPEDFIVSRATVYNTLELFVKCRLLVKHQFDTQQTEYETITASATHHHRICINCGKVTEFSDQKMRRAILNRKFNAFCTEYYSLYLYGYCKKCQKKMRF